MSSIPRPVRFHVPGFCFVLLAAALALAYAPPAQAANPSAGNQNQLVNAINTVNGAGAGTHTITLTADITLTTALPVLTNAAATEVVLDGDGHTLTGDAAHTILKINPGATVRVRDVTLTRGGSYGTEDEVNGGAIYNRGQLTVEDAQLIQNSADGGGGIYVHGGAGNAADLTLTRVIIQANGASAGGGAGLAAVADGGEVSVAISQSVLLENNASGGGAGILLNGGGGEARLTVDSTAIIRNTSMGVGSGLHIDSDGGVAAALLLNTTVSGNENPFGGGGIALYENGGTAELGLAFSTVAYNIAANGSAILNSGAAITLAASIISANGAGLACASDAGPFAATSAGHNLGDDDTCDLDAATDTPSGQTLLHFLQPVPATYGETHAHPLDALSDAQQAVPAGVLGCGTTVAQDQRGQPRPVPAGKCDIGAYESDAATSCAPPLTAGNEAGLNFAIACANSAGAGTHTITLTADITLTTGTTWLNNTAATEIILDGDGHTIDGGGNGPILLIENDTTARVRDVTLTHGASDLGAAIFSTGRLTVENSQLIDNSGFRGPGVHSDGDVTITGSTISGNTADYGGAVALVPEMATATLTINNSVLRDNSAAVNGGALYVFSSNDAVANVSLTGVTVENNTSPNGTGGIDLIAGDAGELTATIAASRIVNNVGYRGGLGVISGTGVAEATVTGSTVAGNSSTAQGGISESSAGGIFVRSNTGGTTSVTIFNSTVSGNATGRAGGGLLVAAGGGAAGANVVYSTLAGNTSGTGGGGIHTLAGNGGTASVTLSATIITNGDGAGPDCARPGGAIISTGFNLAGDGTCFLNQASDLPAGDAGLLPLALNAPGSTPTHALPAGSPALDRIPPGGLGCGTAIAADQRGVARPQPAGGRCDVGAYERQPVAPAFSVLLPTIRGE